jgi:UDP-N-acetyl-D-mannosaminuronic acid dehydrogenase
VTQICVLGLGYIGLPTASMFATQGHQVLGVDIDSDLVAALKDGKFPIQEPGLNMLVQSATRSGNLSLAAEPGPADVFIIAVPTPLLRPDQAPGENGHDPAAPKPDLSYVRAAAEAILPYLEPGCLVVLESTSPPGTTTNVVRPILERSGMIAGSDFSLAYCAERVLPGRISVELVTNDRIVGGVDRVSSQRAKELYASFVDGEMFQTDTTTAEMVKLMENTYRDVNIALANEFSRVAGVVGVNVHEAIALANRHPRVNILRPGPGVGGHCIAVDPWFVVDADRDDTALIRAARNVNDGQPNYVAKIIERILEGIERPVVALLGLAYKADVDDLRGSPSLEVARLLVDRGYTVRTHEPAAVRELGVAATCGDLASAVSGADLAVLLTDHTAYRDLDPRDEALSGLSSRRILDTRDCLELGRWQAAGFVVFRLGAQPAPGHGGPAGAAPAGWCRALNPQCVP